MSDDKSKVGQQDRSRVSASERYEVDHLAKKFGLTSDKVVEVIKSHGPMREAVEQQLGALKNRN